MTNKELFILLANAYLQEYNREVAIYDALFPLRVTLESEDKPLVCATETALEKLVNNDYIIDMLLDFNQDKYIVFTLPNDNDTTKEVICSSLEELYDFIICD